MSACRECGQREPLDAVRVEVRRCQRAVDGGSPRDFWVERLTDYAKTLEAAAVILRMEIAALKERSP